MPASAPLRRFHYAWIIGAITFTTLLTTAGVRATPSVLMVPLEREFGWSRASISFAISINLLLYGLIGPFAAALMDRFGLRRMTLLALSAVTLGVALSTQIKSTWQLLLFWGVLVGGGTGMTALVLGAMVANRWFHQSRGLVMGILTASSATGQMIFLPALATVVSRSGWRPAVLLVAGVCAILIPLVGLLMRDRPSELGLLPYGASAADELEPGVKVDRPFLLALTALWDGFHSRDFWLLAGSFFVCGLSTNGLIGTHLIPACMDVGIPEVKAAGLLAAMGLFDLLGTTGSGWLSDRFDNRVLLSCYYGFRGIALIYLPFALRDASWGLSAFALLYGLDWIATVPPTVKLAAEAFGRARAGIMFGWIVAFHQVGAAVATYGAGTIRSVVGDYQPAFLASGAFCLATAAMVLYIRPNGATAGSDPETEGLESEPLVA